MSPHEWKVLAAFGCLTGALALYDSSLALKVVTIATVVIVVRNADKIPYVGASSSSSPRKKTTGTAPHPAGASILQV